jgi:hypothetical protein
VVEDTAGDPSFQSQGFGQLSRQKMLVFMVVHAGPTPSSLTNSTTISEPDPWLETQATQYRDQLHANIWMILKLANEQGAGHFGTPSLQSRTRSPPMPTAPGSFSVDQLTPELLPQVANLWHVFGYFTLSGVIDQATETQLLQLARAMYQQRRGKSLDRLPDAEGAFEGSIWEEFPAIPKRLLTPTVLDLIQALLGEQWLYLGSDLSIFSKTSTQPWHRDWDLPLPILKIGYYMNTRRIRTGGEFRIIPGSHRSEDSYASQLKQALAWPSPLTQPGGLNERGFL